MTERNAPESRTRVLWADPGVDTVSLTYRCLGCYAEFRDASVFDNRGYCPRCAEIVDPAGVGSQSNG